MSKFTHIPRLSLAAIAILPPGLACAQLSYINAFNAGASNNDYGYSIALDASSNSYVTGFFTGTVDFDPGSGTANLTAVGSEDIFIAKYSSSGAYVWAINVGSTSVDRGYSIAVDGNSNVYVTGHFNATTDFDPDPSGFAILTSSGAEDIFVAKYSPTGAYVWAFKIGSSGWDVGYSLTLDASANVYVTGHFSNSADFDPDLIGTTTLTSAGATDIFVARYTSSGTFGWAFSIGGTTNDYGGSITLDAASNVYVTGNFQLTQDFDPGSGTANLTSAGSRDIFVASYTSSGAYLWAFRAGSTGIDAGHSIATDNSSNVYVTGLFANTVDFNPGSGTANLTSTGGLDIFVAKYTPSGTYIWAFKAGSTLADDARSIAIDPGANVYVSGEFQGTADFDPSGATYNLTSVGNYDIFASTYDSSGNFLCAMSVGAANVDYGYAIAVDDNAYMYVTGYFAGTADFDPGSGTANLTSAGQQDVFVAKYDGCAVLLSVNLLHFDATLEANGSVRTEWLTASTGSAQFFEVERSRDARVFEHVGTVGPSSQGNGYAFYDEHPLAGVSYYRLKQVAADGSYAYSPLREVRSGDRQLIFLYPNPARDHLRCVIHDADEAPVHIAITDVMGREHTVLTDLILEGVTPLELSTAHLPGGTYLLRISHGQQTSVQPFAVQR